MSLTISGGDPMMGFGSLDRVRLISGATKDPTLIYVEQFDVVGGTLSVIDRELAIDIFNLTGGTLDGKGTLTINKSATWTAGTMTGTGKTVNTHGSILEILGSDPKTLTARTLQNLGKIRWTEAEIFGDTGTIDTMFYGEFAASGIFHGTLVDNSEFTSGTNGTAGTFSISGAYTQSSSHNEFFHVDLLTPQNSDLLNVSGVISLDGSLILNGLLGFHGSQFMLINNTGLGAINGTFLGLPEGSSVSVGTATYIISYVGGDGNDVVITGGEPPPPYVPPPPPYVPPPPPYVPPPPPYVPPPPPYVPPPGEGSGGDDDQEDPPGDVPPP